MTGFLAMGDFPAGSTYAKRYVTRLKNRLAAAVLKATGQDTLTASQEQIIFAAMRAEGVGLLLWSWLRREGGAVDGQSQMPLADRITLTDKILAATAQRDAYIRRLPLPEAAAAPEGDLWASLDHPPREATDEPGEPPADAHAANAATETGNPPAGEPEGGDGKPSGPFADDDEPGGPGEANSDETADDSHPAADEASRTPQGDDDDAGEADDHDDDDHDDIGNIDVVDNIDDPEGLR